MSSLLTGYREDLTDLQNRQLKAFLEDFPSVFTGNEKGKILPHQRY